MGVPLVLAFAEAGLTVNINDLNETALATLRSGKLPYIEHGAAPLLARALAGKKLLFTSSPDAIGRTGPVVITIGTPVDEFLNPVRDVIQACLDPLLPHIKDGQLLVLRSTLFPGTTEWIDRYLHERGRKLKVAFCPERIAQGYGIDELRKMPQLVSGTTPEAEDEAAALFAKPSKLPSLSACAARMKPPQAAAARPPPTLTRRTPVAATLSRVKPSGRLRRTFTGFGATASTIARIWSAVVKPGA